MVRTGLLLGCLLLSARWPLAALDYEVRLETPLVHDDGRFLWYHPRAAAIPSATGPPAVILTLQQHLHVSDYYSGLHVMHRETPGGAWSGPTAIPELAWRKEPDGTTLSVADVTPGWHAPTGKLLAIGCQVPYGPGGEELDLPRRHQTAYAVYDPATRQWSGWNLLEMPPDARFDFARNACSQWQVEPGGNLLLPVYFGPNAREPFSVTVVECRFDGRRLQYLRHGTELRLAVRRGLVEPSLTRFGNEYFLTLRNDEQGYVTRSQDGLAWEPIQPWRFEDGAELGSYNTQQHWITHSGGLFLVYTRRGADNDHIPRHRAPLFMARVDPGSLRLLRGTERVVVPERGAELGNFGASAISAEESWVTVSEGVWDAAARSRGARGATFVARIGWKEPNRLVEGAAPQESGGNGPFRIAVFEADVTVPIGHPMMGGAWKATRMADPLEARGLVLLGAGLPLVVVSVDWCEIRNDAYKRWQALLSEAAGTRPDRVMISAVHQHDAPVADLEAERRLRERGLPGTVCDPDFHEQSVRRVAEALRASLAKARPLTHVGTGQARVDRVASNRRYLMPDGQVRFDRTSSTRNVFAREAGEGLIDPWLKTLSFWDEETPVAALSFYAVHPMSHYGAGEVSADFPGLARRMRQRETPGTAQLYFSGASGNLTAGKYNDGAPENRAVLAGRLQAAMAEAWRTTTRHPATRINFRSIPLPLEPRSDPGFTPEDLEQRLATATQPFQQCLAALGLSWRSRAEAGIPLQVPVIDLGPALFLLLPGESYVEYQLAAQALRPGALVCVAGYGDGATGYIPTERHIAERDTNLADWSWVAPGSEPRMREAIRQALLPEPAR